MLAPLIFFDYLTQSIIDWGIIMERKLKKYGLIFIAVAMILLALFMFYPVLYSFYLSLTSTKLGKTDFVWFANYKRILTDPLFWISLKNTFVILLIQVPVMLFLALILATILNDKSIKFRGFFRTALFLPAVTSLIAYTILFKMLFSYTGLLNTTLMRINLISEPIEWMSNPITAKAVLIIAMIWRWTGYNMVFYLSGMQNISEDIYEAASIDGASKIKSFFMITLPLLKPMILFTTIMSTIGTLQLFDEPMNLSQGGVTAATIGPSNSLLTLSVYIYNLSFKYVPNFGYGATVAYVIVILIGILTLIQFRVGATDDEKEARKLKKQNRREKRRA